MSGEREYCWYTSSMDQVRAILSNHFPTVGWSITKPLDGASKDSFIAKSDHKAVFIKFDVKRTVLDRLSELGIAPKVIGESDSPMSYVIQEFIEGTQPGPEWFGDNLPRIAEVINTYHADSELKALLGGEKDYDDHVNQQLQLVEKMYSILMESKFGNDELENMFQMFRVQTEHLHVTPLVPVHADPNNHNFILSGDKIYLLDWDDILLSDPMHDIGLLLFWYVPKNRWEEFFKAYGTELDEDRIYWWIARGSLAIAHWFYERSEVEKTAMFLANFKAAVMKEENQGLRRDIV